MLREKRRLIVILLVAFILKTFVFYDLAHSFFNEKRVRNKCEKLRPFIEKELNKFAFSHFDVELICALIQVESEFNPRAKSHAQAWGLMQITPIAWQEFVNMNGRGIRIRERKKVKNNLLIGIWYLHYIHKKIQRYKKKNLIHTTLSAYWMGMQGVRQKKVEKTIYSQKIKKIYFKLQEKKPRNHVYSEYHLINASRSLAYFQEDGFIPKSNASEKLHCSINPPINKDCPETEDCFALRLQK